VGGTGYIGSRLYRHLRASGFDTHTVDLETYGNYVNPDNLNTDYRSLSRAFLQEFDALVMLAGHSSVSMAINDATGCLDNNLMRFVELTTKLSPHQKLIYMSSASVYGNSPGRTSQEEGSTFAPVNIYDISKYALDLCAPLADVRWYGLRLGTVCGFSPSLRADLMVNAMCWSAVNEGEVRVFNGNTWRSILGISDLCRAIVNVLAMEDAPIGVYNVGSFNDTAENVGATVAGLLSVPLVKREVPRADQHYNFKLGTRKFESTFGFEFMESVETIVGELSSRWDDMKISTRNGLPQRRNGSAQNGSRPNVSPG
jgi:nucleoside-diphosphate-sugar epimerase